MSTRRPKPKAHHSSIFHRIHQRHDARHHPGEDRTSENRPLLQEEHPDSASEHEESTTEPSEAPLFRHRLENGLRQFKDSAGRKITQAVETSSSATASSASRLGQIAKQASSLAKKSVIALCGAVKRNPKRILIVLCIMLAVASLGEAVELYRRYQIPTDIEICTSPGCVHIAHTILDSLHPRHVDMDPCSEFDNYVCGGFDLKYDLDSKEIEKSRETLKFDIIRRYLHKFLNQDESFVDEHDRNLFQKAKNAYDACQNQQKLDEFGIKPLKALTDEIKLLFSRARSTTRKIAPVQTVVSASTDRDHILTLPYLQMLKMGVEEFVSFEVKPNLQAPPKHAIYINPAKVSGLMLTDVEAFDNHRLVQEYEHIIEDVLTEFIDVNTNKSLMLHRSSKPNLSLKDLARGIVRLETKLNTIRPSDNDLQNMTKYYHVKTIQEFEKMMPYLAVGSLIQDLAPPGYQNSTLIVSSPHYFKQLSSALSATTVETLQAFCIWRIVQAHSDRVEHESLQRWKQFSLQLGKQYFPTNDRRWHACIDSVDEDLGWILLRFWLQHGFTLEMEEQGSFISSDTKKEVTSFNAAQEWITRQEKHLLLEVANATEFEVGYPVRHPDLLSLHAIENHYERVITANDTFLDNKVRALRNKLWHRWSLLGLPNQEGAWQKPLTLVNAYHEDLQSKVVLPAATMQAPYFDQGTPHYLAYSTFAVSAASQMIQLFSSRMAHGVANGSTWMTWSPHTQATLDSKKSCFQKQHDNSFVNMPKRPRYGNKMPSLQESISEAGAIRAAYRAWLKSEGHLGIRLPGLQEFTPSQLFWLSYGSSRCSKTTSEQAEHRESSATQTPESIRIKATVANSREFKEAFHCPVKEPVCELW